jgi:hypothetical protein
MLRLEDPSTKLNKMERYGNPTDRPIHPSALRPNVLEAAVVSYLRHAYFGRSTFASGAETAPSAHPNAGAKGRMSARRDWEWRDIAEANATVDFEDWKEQMLPALSAVADGDDGSRYLMGPGNQAMLR